MNGSQIEIYHSNAIDYFILIQYRIMQVLEKVLREENINFFTFSIVVWWNNHLERKNAINCLSFLKYHVFTKLKCSVFFYPAMLTSNINCNVSRFEYINSADYKHLIACSIFIFPV